MELRALEPEDLPALAALCARPAIAAELDELPGPASLQGQAGARAAVGAFEAGALVGAAGLAAPDRPRLRHLGRAWLAAEVAAAGPLLGVIVELAFDWWNLDRLELALRADSPLHAAAAAGFTRELVRRADLRAGEGFADRWDYVRLRPGLAASSRPRTFPRPLRAPLPASFEIRPVGPADAGAFARVLADPGVTWATLQVPHTPAASWSARLAANDPARNRLFGAFVDGVQVGNCGLHGAGSPRRQHVWAMGMAVADAWQGRGVGRALMERLVAEADALGIRRLELDVYTDNLRAIALYEKFGFVREGVRRLEAFREGGYADALVMARLR